uniref:6-phosphogluconolactonase n=1 Tax=Amazona collaria TaxID=241587 RepID=A0A8B9FFK6_9PSIT
MAPGAARRVSVLPEPGPGLARFVAERAAAAVGGGRFALGVSGGSLVELLTLHLPPAVGSCPAAPARWLLAFCDERLVPPEHPDSTAGARLLPRLPGPGPRVLAPSPGLSPAAAAADYAAKLRQAFPGEDVPVFDLLLLGVGPDGHTCSLFPGHRLLQEQETIVAAITDSPKPPPERITFTLPVLNAAKAVVFVATGKGKAAVVKVCIQTPPPIHRKPSLENPLPAARVQPHSGQLYWILDEAAAKELTIPVENSIL